MFSASNLEGKTVGKWKVLKKRIKTEDDNSGAFSSCYEVEDQNGNPGFLKAFNVRYAFNATGGATGESIMSKLNTMTEEFLYEKKLLGYCNEGKLHRVVRAIDSGEYREKNDPYVIPYLVFEIAIGGNLKNMDHIANANLSWKLHTFHGVLVGVSQLHQNKIAHQDIKPSNILIFGKDYSKIGDLGRAIKADDLSSWYDISNHNGDLRYAPIELFYNHLSTDWSTRRYGADFFMLGGLLSFMVSGVNILGGIFEKLDPKIRPDSFGGQYSEVLPNINSAFYETLSNTRDALPNSIRDELTEIIEQLSFPEPEKRGNPHPKSNNIGQFSLRRYISRIDYLAKKVNFKE